MARIKGVPPAQAGLYVKMAYYFTRRGIAKLTGRAPGAGTDGQAQGRR